jgi:hypothetical protein
MGARERAHVPLRSHAFRVCRYMICMNCIHEHVFQASVHTATVALGSLRIPSPSPPTLRPSRLAAVRGAGLCAAARRRLHREHDCQVGACSDLGEGALATLRRSRGVDGAICWGRMVCGLGGQVYALWSMV